MKSSGRYLGVFFVAVLISLLVACGASTAPIAITLSPSGSKAVDQAQTVSITASVQHDAKNGGVTWSVSGGGTLSNQSATSATYNTPVSVSSPITAMVTATSISDTSKSATLQITVNPVPTIATQSVQAATAGTNYSATINASGGTSPFTWSLSSGTLPAGITMAASTTNSVTISGMPTGPGTSPVTFKVVDATSLSATQPISIVVNQPPALTITTGSLGAGVMGTAYNQTVSATGGVPTYHWAVTSGNLPAGLSLNTSSGMITGTPSGTFTGTSNFTMTITDSETPTATSTSANLSISVTAPPISVTTNSLTGGTLGTAYSASLGATGGITPYAWSISAGSLPAGLTLNAGTGAISGTPTGNVTGPVNFTVKVTDAETPTAKTATAALSITISTTPLSVTTSSLAVGVDGSAYTQTLQATGGVSPYSWTVTTGTLPTGLSLNSSTGVISGTPTGSSATFTVTATDSETPTPQTANKQLTITVNPQLAVTTASLPAGTVGTAYNQTLGATGGITPYTWAVTVGSLPAGLTLNSTTGAITGTPTGPLTGAVNFTVTVTDSESPAKTASAALSIIISATPLSITTLTLPGGTLGTAYNSTVSATGGITPYAWSISAGALPAGLTLNPGTGAISGIPTGSVTGPINFTVKVTDAEVPTAQSATAALSITITAAPLSVVTSSLPTGVVGSAYSTTLQAAGGVSPYTWSITTGSLPAGLSLNTSTGVVSGTPSGSGSTFTVTVTDSETPTPQTASKQLTITVNPQLTVTTSSLGAGVVGTTYNQTLSATGGITPYSWAITVGSLPAGLSLNSTSGAITGTPTGPFVGTTNFTATVTDSESPTKTASAALSITVSAATLTITTTTLGPGVLGQAYSTTLGATGGVQPYTWSILSGSLPAGLTLNPATGQITGIPTATGTSNFTVKVVDSETPTAQSATAGLSLSINNSLPLQITTSGPLTGLINYPYSAALTASGGIQPYSWSITGGSLPPGLTLTLATGQISGTPTAQGTFNFTVKVTDSSSPNQSVSANLSITINGALTITTTTLPSGTDGSSYNATVTASGGLPPYSWSVSAGSLPNGLNLNSNTGQISGTPTATGTFNFTVEVADSETPAANANANLSITINNGVPLQIDTNGLPEGSEATQYFATLYASGGQQPYTWSISTGSLPSGLSLNATTGAITGKPTVLGTTNFTVKVTDSGSQTATEALSIFVITCNNDGALTGDWAMLLEGFNNNQQPAPVMAEVGSFVADGAGNITSGSVDTNDQVNGPVSGTISSGKYCMTTNNTGLVTVTQNVPVSNTVHTFAIALNSSNSSGRIIYYDNSTFVASGPLRKQTASAFATNKINGDYAFGLIGADGGGPATVSRFGMAGEFTSNGAGTLSGMADADADGTVYPQVTLQASDFTVSSSTTGRGTVSIDFVNQGTIDFVFYVVNTGEILMMGDDTSTNPLIAGDVLEQTEGGTFTDLSLDGTSILGAQSVDNNGSSPVGDVIGGFLTTTGSGSYSISFDENDGGTAGTDTGSGTYSVSSNGRVSLTGGNHAPVIYLIGQNQGFIVGTDTGVTFGQFNPQTGSSFTNASISGTYTGGGDFPEDVNSGSEVNSVTGNAAGGLTGISLNDNGGGSGQYGTISATYTVSSDGRTIVSQGGNEVGIMYIMNSTSVLFIPAGGTNGNNDPTLEWFFQ
ncbi:MAG: putative Ig domain-containing protein [Terriglobales bacterium]